MKATRLVILWTTFGAGCCILFEGAGRERHSSNDSSLPNVKTDLTINQRRQQNDRENENDRESETSELGIIAIIIGSMILVLIVMGCIIWTRMKKDPEFFLLRSRYDSGRGVRQPRYPRQTHDDGLSDSVPDVNNNNTCSLHTLH